MSGAERSDSRSAVGDRFALAVLRAACGYGPVGVLAVDDPALWPPLIRRAEFHGLLPQLAEALPALRETSPPPAAAVRDIERRRTARAQTHLAGLATLVELDAAARAEGLDYVALKGPALAVALFHDRPARSYEDVDVLVRRGDRARARRALEARAYRPTSGRWLTRWLERAHFHLVHRPPGPGRLPVELHWSLLDRANLLRIDEGDVFASRGSRRMAGADIPVLARDVEILYLCLHAAKHGVLNGRALRRDEPAEWFCAPRTGNRLKWFLDLHAFLLRFDESLDWPAARRRLEQWNAADEVGESLRVLDRLVPDGRALRAAGRLGLEAGGESRGAKRSSSPAGRPGLGDALLRGAMKPSRSVTVRPIRALLAWRSLFPPPAKLRRYYRDSSRWPLPLLYLRHPFHMVRKMLS